MTRRSRCRGRSGLTLLEVLVALMLTATIAAMARTTIESAQRFSALERATAAAHDRQMNGERHLKALVVRSFVQDSATRFLGTARGFVLSTFCETGGGWLEECRVAVDVAVTPAPTVRFTVPRQETSVLSFAAPVRIAYMLGSGTWVADWNSQTTLPLAIAIESGERVLVLRIGDRG